MGLKLYSWVFVILCMSVHCVSSQVYVKFLQTPREFSNLTSATFAFQVLVDALGLVDAPGNCTGTNRNQTANCKLNHIPSDCENGEVFYSELQDGDHTFEVCTNGTLGAGCTHYNWTIDTVPPTANVTAVTSFTNDPNVSVNIYFSEPCTGFGCSSSNSCNLLVDGDGQVIPNTLSILQPNLTYSLTVSLSSNVQYGRVGLGMDTEFFCTDKAGNRFTRTPNSTFYVNFDRRSALVEVGTEVPEHPIQLRRKTGTVYATNNYRDLKYHLKFSEPVLNSSDQVLNSLHITHGSLVPIIGSTLDNRSFEFQVENISGVAIVTVSLNSSLIKTGRGTPISPIEPITFLYDTQRPVIKLTTTSTRTTENSIQIRIKFSKPLVGFNRSAINISGGQLQGLDEVSSSIIYDVKIQVVDNVTSVQIPENVVEDIAGNKNLASNVVLVKHYPVPLISVVLSTTATTAFAATSLAAGILTVSTASLQTIGPFSNPPSPTSDLGGNIFRILCHIQVFTLSSWLSHTLPIEYDEFAKGLQWSIPYFSLPWESKTHTTQQVMLNSSSPPNSNSYGFKISELVFFNKSIPSLEQKHLDVATTVHTSSDSHHSRLTEEEIASNIEPNVTKSVMCSDSQDLKGWKDFKRSMFWLLIMGGSAILLHAIVLLVLKLRKNEKNSNKQDSDGVITFPRFLIFVVLTSLTCICEGSANLVKGKSPSGIAIGIMLLCIVYFLVLALFLFLLIGVTSRLLQYKEEVKKEGEIFHPRYQRLCGISARKLCDIIRVVVGPRKESQWTWKEQHESVRLKILGPIFEDLRGPPRYVQLGDGGGNTSVDETKDTAPTQLDGGDTSVDERKDDGGNPLKQLGDGGGNTSVDEIKDTAPTQLDGGVTSVDERKDDGGNPLKQLGDGGGNTSVETKDTASMQLDGDDNSVDEKTNAGGNPPKQLSSDDISIDERKDAAAMQFGGGNNTVDERKDAGGNLPKQLGGGGDTSIVERVDARGNPPKRLGGGGEVPFIQKLFGILRIYYMLLESVRRVALGVSAGAYPDKCSTKTPTIVLLCMTSFQLFYLVLTKPFIKRQNQLVEIIAFCGEVGVFATSLVLTENLFSDQKTKRIGIFMLILFLVPFLAQMITQCYALYYHIKQMDTKEGSFMFGLRTASFGFLLFFFPYKLIKDVDSEVPLRLGVVNDLAEKL